MKLHEGQTNRCTYCNQTLSRERDLKRHIATVHRHLLNPFSSSANPRRRKKGRPRTIQSPAPVQQDRVTVEDDQDKLPKDPPVLHKAITIQDETDELPTVTWDGDVALLQETLTLVEQASQKTSGNERSEERTEKNPTASASPEPTPDP